MEPSSAVDSEAEFNAAIACAFRYFDSGTCGPDGAGLGGAGGGEFGPAGRPGMPFCNWLRRPPACPSGTAGVGVPGASWTGPPVLMIEAGCRWKLASHDRAKLVTKKPAASSAVVRVS